MSVTRLRISVRFSELDAEKAKLQEIKDRLSDIKAMAKDKSLGQNERDNAKALIASVQAEYSEQRERVLFFQLFRDFGNAGGVLVVLCIP